MRKTKIICTLGPSTDKGDVLRDLIANGMNCARFNFSHGDHAEHLNRINMVREAAKKVGAVLAERAKEKGIEEVVFDRGGYLYHGRVAELAEGAREGGLEF